MKKYIKHDEWCIIEEGFHRKHNRITESLCSIGNGRMGQRANFEEQYSGDSMQGSYIAGIFYPDKTRVGWWKNGYPDYFAKVLNACNWIGLDIEIDGEVLDLAHCEVDDFIRVLNMKEGYLERSFEAKMKSGRIVKVKATRFCSIIDDEAGAIRYSITPKNFSGKLSVSAYLDADVENEDSNYDHKFWDEVAQHANGEEAYVIVDTKDTEFDAPVFRVCTGMTFAVEQEGEVVSADSKPMVKEKYAACTFELSLNDLQETVIYKYAANLTSENHDPASLLENCKTIVSKVAAKGFDTMKKEQAAAWTKKWKGSDIVIEGDVAAQQGIRFNIFHLNQTYTGEDDRLNIGPKGFTGEKYGGSTYWDTEAYCLPFYLATAEEKIARNLLVYRHRHLAKAIENAAKLGFKDGAALYPMVTITGEECHNEWEITFEEIHRNGAIAFAIYDYIRFTGDQEYLAAYGLEVLIAIARFWAQRVHYSTLRNQFVMHGVTGPNEYENNVNNNWYTSYIAVWCLNYCMEALDFVKQNHEKRYDEIVEQVKFYEHTETKQWKAIAANMFLPEEKELGILLQQDTYMDKELLVVDDLKPEDRPLNQKWSWDRILRSCFIKQADVLQGLFLFEDQFDVETIRRNFKFYEPRTVHESSLSPCVHAILAAKIGDYDKAYEMYVRTSRLDLDDYNNDSEDGLHITSMAGTWMSVVQGFGGMRVRDGQLVFNPFIPDNWKSYAFKIRFRNRVLKIKVSQDKTMIFNESADALSIRLNGELHEVNGRKELVV